MMELYAGTIRVYRTARELESRHKPAQVRFVVCPQSLKSLFNITCKSIAEGSLKRLMLHNSAGGDTLVVLVGNSKNLWPVFLEACQIDPSLLETADPLDTYIERSVQATLQSCLPG